MPRRAMGWIRGRRRRVPSTLLLVGTIAALVTAPAPEALAAEAQFHAFHLPAGVVLRGEKVLLRVDVQTTDLVGDPVGFAFVRGSSHGPFTRLRFAKDGGGGLLPRRVPSELLGGRILEEYVVVHDSGTDKVLRVPPAGAYRSWIRDSVKTLNLGTHEFGHLRSPGASVARAAAGDGPGEAGFLCEPEGVCQAPSSFDVGRHGGVWVVDDVNSRLLGWDPGHPDRPARTIPLAFYPSDIAIGHDGTIYLTGHRTGGGHPRLYAYTQADTRSGRSSSPSR